MNGNTPDYMIKNGATYRFTTDHLGSVREVVEITSSGLRSAQEIHYNEFGDTTANINRTLQRFGFAGGITDDSTGLVHFGARDYDPETGRWLSKDPIGFAGGDTNLYGYVLNDPVNLIDPSGLNACGMNQESGTVVCIDHNGNLTAVDTKGYSGKGPGKNNPSMQNVAYTGPIPKGTYKVGDAYKHKSTGMNTRNLDPSPNTRATFPSQRDPDTFRWHGDNGYGNGTASEGCPISGPASRLAPPPGTPFTVY